MITEAAQERATLYALGLLDAGEATAFEQLLDADAELRALAAELRETAAELARVDEIASPAGLKVRVLAGIDAEGSERQKAERGEPTAAADYPETGKVVSGPWGGWVPWTLAATLMLCCGALALSRDQLQKKFSALEQTMETVDQRVAAMNRATLTPAPVPEALRQVAFCPLEATPAEDAKPRAAVLWDAARREGVLRVSKLPPPGEGKDYELWAVEAGRKETVSAGLVTPGAEGNAEVRFRPVAEGGKDEVLAFAISVERAGGSAKNEGPILFLGKL